MRGRVLARFLVLRGQARGARRHPYTRGRARSLRGPGGRARLRPAGPRPHEAGHCRHRGRAAGEGPVRRLLQRVRQAERADRGRGDRHRPGRVGHRAEAVSRPQLMPRERWFFAQDNKRRGPVPMAQLLEGLLRTPDPMGSLVWRHGLAGWTRAGEVPEVERKISPFVATRQAATPADARPAPGSGGDSTIPRTPRRGGRPRRPAPRYQEEPAPAAATSSATLYVASSAAGVVVLGFLAF